MAESNDKPETTDKKAVGGRLTPEAIAAAQQKRDAENAAEAKALREAETERKKEGKKLVTLITPYHKVHPKTRVVFQPNQAVPHEVDNWVQMMVDKHCMTVE